MSSVQVWHLSLKVRKVSVDFDFGVNLSFQLALSFIIVQPTEFWQILTWLSYLGVALPTVQ